MTGDEFNVFCDKTAEIVRITHTGGYSDVEAETVLGEVTADIQPYASPHDQGLTQQEYGREKDAVLRMFVPQDADVQIEVGDFVRYDGVLYSISRVDMWELGKEVLLYERD